VCRRATQHLVLLLQQLDPPPGLTQFSQLATDHSGLRALVDLGLTHPLHRVNPEVLRNLLDRHSGIPVASHANDIVTELTRIRLGHSNIL
jgi:hypothetical protein